MPVMVWTDALKVGVDFMDEDHEEAVHLIAAMAEASGTDRLALLDRFIAHCREHFAREEEMMKAVGFFAYGCHQGEHERVLEELASVRRKLESGSADLEPYFQRGLPDWLLNHRDTMDMVTAHFAQQSGWKAA